MSKLIVIDVFEFSFNVNDELDINYSFNKTTVPAGEYFMLGDNTVLSMDSRFYGTIPETDIKGDVILIIKPFKN